MSTDHNAHAAPDQGVVEQIGFWSATLATASILIFDIAIGLGAAGLATRSIAIGSSLFLALFFLVLISCIHRYASEEKRVWTQIGLSFVIVYATLAGFNYFLQLTVVQQNPQEYSWLTMDFTPDTAFWALEVFFYSLMGLAALFVTPVFIDLQIGKVILWLFSVNALFTVLGAIAYILTGNPLHILILLSLGIWAIVFPIGTALIARYFKQAK